MNFQTVKKKKNKCGILQEVYQVPTFPNTHGAVLNARKVNPLPYLLPTVSYAQWQLGKTSRCKKVFLPLVDPAVNKESCM